MDLRDAAATLQAALHNHRPRTFDASWVERFAPASHDFARQCLRTALGDIDWDALIGRLEKPFQTRWIPDRPLHPTRYRSTREVRLLLRPYADKRYVFLAALDEEDRRLRDRICIPLARLAQRGNRSAEEKLLEFLDDLLSGWMEQSALLRRWSGYPTDVEHQFRACIRRYRYTGSFVGYVWTTLAYAGRGLLPEPLSLDEPAVGSTLRPLDRVVLDAETEDVMLYGERT